MKPDPLTTFDAQLASSAREVMTTSLGTAELRELGAGVLARSVFTARGTNAIFVSKLKEVVDAGAAGDLSEGQMRTALYETLDALGYDSEKGGFAGEEVPPALKGTLQDLRSFRRMNLIVRTQMDLMHGAGLQFRGHQPDRLAQFPAWELVRLEDRTVPRDWPARWAIAGGKLYGGPASPNGSAGTSRMIAFKGDPVWGELGAWENFQDALGIDHPPFAFQSGMGWKEISLAECDALGVSGPNGESRKVWFDGNLMVMAGKLPLPSPQLSMRDVDPALADAFRESTRATSKPGTPMVMDYSDLLASELRAGANAYQQANPDYISQGGGR